MNDFTITSVIPDDSPGINALLYETWLETYPNEDAGITRDDIEERFKDRLLPERMEKARERLMNFSENEQKLVAKSGEKVVGFLRVIRNEECNKLQAIYVLPSYQGKGVGTALWEEGRKFLDSAKDTLLEVATYNEKAIGFYTRLGFVDTGERTADERFRMKSGNVIPEMVMRLGA